MPIPKTLHYVWFGGNPFPKREARCYRSWERHLAAFQFKRWDETNFDVHCNRYVEEAYEAKKYQYVSDYCRLQALYNEGGLYLDTDCFVTKNFSGLMDGQAFTGFGGDNQEIAAHALAFSAGNLFIREVLDSYKDQSFIKSDGSYNTYTINRRMTDMLLIHGFQENGIKQEICGITIYPMTYFCPLSMLPDTVKDCISKNTYCIHIWSSKELKRERSLIVRLAHKTRLNLVKRKILEIVKG